MNSEQIQEFVDRIRYRPHTGFKVTGQLLQHWQVLEDAHGDGGRSMQYGRKWYISEHAVESEILQTALRAVLDFEEHEARESFKFDGSRLYGPHIDYRMLQQASRTVEVRKP